MKSSASIAARNANRYQTLSRVLGAGTGTSLPSVLEDLALSFGLAEAGVRWPVSGPQQVLATVGTEKECGYDRETAAQLASAHSSDEVLVDPMGSRFLIPLVFESRSNGVFWARLSSQTNGLEEDRTALVLAAQCLARHSALLEMIGAADKIRIAQRMQDAAAAAGRIAHDFDNIFTGVVGFAEMAISVLEANATVRQYLNEIMSAGNRGIQFTQQLHQLSRSGVAKPMPTALGPVLASEEARVRKIPNVRIEVETASGLPAVAVDSSSLQILLAHLLDNAVDASPPGGLIRVSAQLIELSEGEAGDLLGNASAGPFVAVRIADEGPGVKGEYRKRLFVEPFFTTKVRRRGLGLPVVYRIVHAHRGGIRFESTAGRGSTVEIALPLAAARPSATETNRIPGA
jgi:signal transduction histidine kinase